MVHQHLGCKLSFGMFRMIRIIVALPQQKRRSSIRIYSTATMGDSFPPASIKALVEEVAQLLHEREETVSVAETVRLCDDSSSSGCNADIKMRQLEVSSQPRFYQPQGRRRYTKGV